MNNIIQIDAILQNHITAAVQKAKEIEILTAAVQKAKEIEILTEQDLTTSTDIVKFIKEKAKQVETQRKNFVDPINASVKNINAQFKALSEPLDEAEKILKSKILDFQRKLEAEKRAIEEAKRKEVEEMARKAAEQQVESGEITQQQAEIFNKQLDFAMQKPIEIEKIRGSATGAVSSIAKRWTYKVVDIQKLANARPDLVEEISSLIRKEIAAGVRNIDGLEIYQEETVSIR